MQAYRQLSLLAFSITVSAPVWAGTCEGIQPIQEIASDSSTVQLGNGTRWRIARPDLIDSRAWQPKAMVLTCDATLVNLDINEDIAVSKLR